MVTCNLVQSSPTGTGAVSTNEGVCRGITLAPEGKPGPLGLVSGETVGDFLRIPFVGDVVADMASVWSQVQSSVSVGLESELCYHATYN